MIDNAIAGRRRGSGAIAVRACSGMCIRHECAATVCVALVDLRMHEATHATACAKERSDAGVNVAPSVGKGGKGCGGGLHDRKEPCPPVLRQSYAQPARQAP